MNQFLPNYELIWKKNNIILFFSTEHFAASFPGKLKWKKKTNIYSGIYFSAELQREAWNSMFFSGKFPNFSWNQTESNIGICCSDKN